MTGTNIPRIPDLPVAVLAEVGRELDVFVREVDSQIGPVLTPMNEIIRDSVSATLAHADVQPSRDLELLCNLAARVAVGKLVTAQGYYRQYASHQDYLGRHQSFR